MKHFFRVIFGRAVITGICLFLQIFGMILMMYRFADNYFYASFAFKLAAFFLALGITAKWENAAYKMVWVFVILAFPIFGLSLYAMFGHSRINYWTRRKYEEIDEEYRMRLKNKISVWPDEKEPFVRQQMKYITDFGPYPAYGNTDVTYYSQPEEALPDMLEAISSAKEFIFLEYFAVEDGEVFRELEQILRKKVQEGVQVRLIFDDFGSMRMVNGAFLRRLREEGIECRVFNPLVPILYVFMNHRDHRKLLVVDGRVSFSGGFNLADRYFNREAPFGHWKDTGIRLTGDAVYNHTLMFLEMWNFIRKTDETVDRFLNQEPYHAVEKGQLVQPFSDIPIDREALGKNIYMNILRHAKHYVYITTPYLIIDDEMNEELCAAAKRGVDVRIVTPGVPDKETIYLLSQSYFARLIDAGVAIYRYTPGFLHAKQYLCDDELAVVGTINMDFRSLYLHFECGTYLYRCDALKKLKEDFESLFAVSERIQSDYGRTRSAYKRFQQLVLRLLSPML